MPDNLQLCMTILTLQWPGRGGWMPPLKDFSCFSPDWGELLFQTNFPTVGTSLSMKKFLRSDLLALKLDKGRVLGRGRQPAPPPHPWAKS